MTAPRLKAALNRNIFNNECPVANRKARGRDRQTGLPHRHQHAGVEPVIAAALDEPQAVRLASLGDDERHHGGAPFAVPIGVVPARAHTTWRSNSSDLPLCVAPGLSAFTLPAERATARRSCGSRRG